MSEKRTFVLKNRVEHAIGQCGGALAGPAAAPWIDARAAGLREQSEHSSNPQAPLSTVSRRGFSHAPDDPLENNPLGCIGGIS